MQNSLDLLPQEDAPEVQTGAENLEETESLQEDEAAKADAAEPDAFGDLLSPKDRSEIGLTQKAIRIKRALESQPRVPLLIPRGKNEPEGATMYFGLNSYKFYVTKGQVVQVPEQIARMYYESIGATEKALGSNERNLANKQSAESRHALNY